MVAAIRNFLAAAGTGFSFLVCTILWRVSAAVLLLAQPPNIADPIFFMHRR